MDIFMEYLKCFVVGGLICVIGQVLLGRTKLTNGKIMVLFLVAGAVLQAIGVYDAYQIHSIKGVFYVDEEQTQAAPPMQDTLNNDTLKTNTVVPMTEINEN